jgi:hypothetical protein
MPKAIRFIILKTGVVRVSPCVGEDLLPDVLDKLFNGGHECSRQP